MDIKSVIFSSNYVNPKETQQIECRVKGSKDKVKVTWPSVIQKYNQFTGSVDLSDQMKVTYLIAENKTGHKINRVKLLVGENFSHFHIKLVTFPQLNFRF